jgi:hypothetical protein
LVFKISDDGYDRPEYPWCSTPPLEIGHWYFVTAIFQQGRYKIFINGELSAEATTPALNIYNSIANIGIGGRARDYMWFDDLFQGVIDEVRIFSHALSEKEVKDLYRLGLVIPATVDIDPDTLNLKSQGK